MPSLSVSTGIVALSIALALPCLAARRSVSLPESQAAGVKAAQPDEKNDPPTYPEAAFRARVEGVCEFRAEISPEGAVTSVAVLRVPQQGLGFEQAVQEAVANWHFRPARRGSTPMASSYIGTVSFTLDSVIHSRMYSARSSDLWKDVLRWAKNAGIKTDTVDESNHILMSKWQQGPANNLPVAVALPDGLSPTRYRMQIFVSPFAEPARVYVATMIESQRNSATTKDTVVVYNAPELSSWFFDQISQATNDPGRLIPGGGCARRQLAEKIQGTLGVAPCVPKDVPNGDSKKGHIVPPVKVFDLTPTYPAPMFAGGHKAEVTWEYHVLEDGSTRFINFLKDSAKVDPQFLAAVKGASRFWIYKPTLMNGCPVLVIATAKTKFDIQ